jgi:hypothetical protein
MTDDLLAYRDQMYQIADQIRVLKLKAIELAAQAERKAKMSRDGIDMAKAYIGLRAVFDIDKSSNKDLTTNHETWKKVRIPKLFEDIGVTNVPVSSFGRRVQVSHKQRVSIRPDKKEEAFKFICDQGYGDSLYTAIQHERLNNIAKELLNEEGIEMPEELFSVYDEPNTSCVKIA